MLDLGSGAAQVVDDHVDQVLLLVHLLVQLLPLLLEVAEAQLVHLRGEVTRAFVLVGQLLGSGGPRQEVSA